MFRVDLEEQQTEWVSCTYSVYQVEYSRNLLFDPRGGDGKQVFQGVIDRTRVRLNVKRLKTLDRDCKGRAPT